MRDHRSYLIVPHDSLSLGNSQAKLPDHRSLRSLTMYPECLARDHWGGRMYVHLNAGIMPHILIESSIEGPRILDPILPSSNWPDSVSGVRFFVGEMLRMILRTDELPDGSIVKAYLPNIVFNGNSSFGGKLAAAEERSARRNYQEKEKEVTIELFFSGAPVVVQKSGIAMNSTPRTGE